jgi:hypothetical protein
MEILIGIALAVGVGLLGTAVGFDRERSFYPVALVVIASIYELFAAVGGSQAALLQEAVPMLAFIGVAVIGFRTNLWLVVAGLAAHGVFDAFHPALISNPGAPAWWPSFCLAYDVVAAGYLAAVCLRNQRVRAAGAAAR